MECFFGKILFGIEKKCIFAFRSDEVLPQKLNHKKVTFNDVSLDTCGFKFYRETFNKV